MKYMKLFHFFYLHKKWRKINEPYVARSSITSNRRRLDIILKADHYFGGRVVRGGSKLVRRLRTSHICAWVNEAPRLEEIGRRTPPGQVHPDSESGSITLCGFFSKQELVGIEGRTNTWTDGKKNTLPSAVSRFQNGTAAHLFPEADQDSRRLSSGQYQERTAEAPASAHRSVNTDVTCGFCFVLIEWRCASNFEEYDCNITKSGKREATWILCGYNIRSKIIFLCSPLAPVWLNMYCSLKYE